MMHGTVMAHFEGVSLAISALGCVILKLAIQLYIIDGFLDIHEIPSPQNLPEKAKTAENSTNFLSLMHCH